MRSAGTSPCTRATVAPSSVSPPFSIGRNCLGRALRDAGHSRVPPPPAMIKTYASPATGRRHTIVRGSFPAMATDWQKLHRAHVSELERRYARALAEHGYDGVVIHSGVPKSRTEFDDQFWALRPTPEFQHW